MDQLSQLCEKFADSSLHNREEVFSHILNNEDTLVSQANEISTVLVKNLPTSEILYSIVCQLIAELAKQGEARNILSSYEDLFKFLDTCLRHRDSQLQACRALGNLCFENEAARSAFVPFLTSDSGLVSVVNRVCSTEYAANNCSELTQLRHVCSGLILNLCNGQSRALSRCVDLGLVQQLIPAAVHFSDPDHTSFLKHTLVICSFMFDDKERCSLLMSTRFVDLLCEALVYGESDSDILETAVECLSDWCRSDAEASGHVASCGVCEHLCRLADSPRTSYSTVKAIGDVLIAIVGCDIAMPVLYKKGEGAVFNTVRHWVAEFPFIADYQSTVSSDTSASRRTLLATVGLYCLVNFSVNDNHSLSMVSCGVHHDVLAHLSPSTLSSSPTTTEPSEATSADTEAPSGVVSDLQRLSGALSALRNFCIPGRNQHQLRSQSVERLLELWSADLLHQQSALMFKYYAVLRLLTDTAGETARCLLTQPAVFSLESAQHDSSNPAQSCCQQQESTATTLESTQHGPSNPALSCCQQQECTPTTLESTQHEPLNSAHDDSEPATACGQTCKAVDIPCLLCSICSHALQQSVSGVEHEARRLLARIVRTLAATAASVQHSSRDGDECDATRRLMARLSGRLSVLSALVRMARAADEDGNGVVGAASTGGGMGQHAEVVVNEALLALTLLVPFVSDRQLVVDSGLEVCCRQKREGGGQSHDQPETMANWESLRRVLQTRFPDLPAENTPINQ